MGWVVRSMLYGIVAGVGLAALTFVGGMLIGYIFPDTNIALSMVVPMLVAPIAGAIGLIGGAIFGAMRSGRA